MTCNLVLEAVLFLCHYCYETCSFSGGVGGNRFERKKSEDFQCSNVQAWRSLVVSTCQILYIFCTHALNAQILQDKAGSRGTVVKVSNEASLLQEQSLALIVKTPCGSGVWITSKLYWALVTTGTVRAITYICCSYWRTSFVSIHCKYVHEVDEQQRLADNVMRAGDT